MKKVIDKAESRGRALYDWLDSHHTFSFDTYYNPRRIFGTTFQNTLVTRYCP